MKNAITQSHPDAAMLRRQRGSFLLESLIAILIVAFGILGLIGLQSRAIQNVDDAQFRSEAVFLTNALIGQMWTSNQATLAADFSAGAPYDEFKKIVQIRLPGAADPTVVFAARAPGNAVDVTITVFWRPPGEKVGNDHQFQATATIGLN